MRLGFDDLVRMLSRKGAAYRAFFRTADGARVLADLMGQANPNDDPTVRRRGGGVDTFDTAVNIGKQRIVAHILEMARIDHNEARRLVAEAEERRLLDEQSAYQDQAA